MKQGSKFSVVTGASTGIGRAVAVELGREGVNVALVARRAVALEETKKLVEEAGGKAEVFISDLSKLEEIGGLLHKLKDWGSNIDVLVNVAGVWHGEGDVYAGRDFEFFEPGVILETYAVGFTAPTLLVHGLLPVMKRGSLIVNLSGTFENGAKGWLPYFASKRGLEDLTLGLSEELEEKGIRVNCVSPSDTATEEYMKYFPEDAKDANSAQEVAKLIVRVSKEEGTGKFWVIKKGQIREGFHS